MIQVDQLSKQYGRFQAIEGVTFQISRGEVVGFLGPNGAGKSTTMRILCGCIGATSGQALIDGKSVLTHPLEVKKRIGYLPETPPLYPNMTVRDYIRFAAQIKDVVEIDTAVERAIQQVGLEDVAHRVIDHLSKGYRQRVGLAQALVHQPDVLVLDEPVSGLDPEQRKEIRDLLTELAAGDRTVILSSHVLGEVEDICDRVIIIQEGRIKTQAKIEELRAGSKRVHIQVKRPGAALVSALEALTAVVSVTPGEDDTYEISVNEDIRPQIARIASEYDLLEFTVDSLEDIYLRLTSGDAQ